MGQSIFSKIKAKLKKDSEDDEEDTELEEEFDEEAEEYDEDEEVESTSNSLVDKIKGQLPILAKILDKVQKKKSVSDEEDDEESTGEFEAPNTKDSAATKTQMGTDDETGDIDISGLEALDGANLSSKGNLKNKFGELKSTLGGKLPFLAKVLNKGGAKASDEEDDEDEEDESVTKSETPKKKIKIIHVVIGAILIFAFASEFFPEEEPPAQVEFKKPVRQKVVKKPEPEISPAPEVTPNPSPEDNIAEAPNDGTELDSVDPVDPVAENTPTEPVENEIQPKDDPIDDNSMSADNTNNKKDELNEMFPEDNLKSPEEKNVEDETDSIAGSSDDTSFTSPTIAQEKIKNDSDIADMDTSNDELNNEYTNQDTAPVSNELQGEVVDLNGSLDFGDKLSDTILKDLEGQMQTQKKEMMKNKVLLPTDAPDYENLGRGLVYNCQGRHWACIDKVSFEDCKKNNAWNGQQSKNTECVPVQVYSDREDCEIVQQHKIDSVAKTDFCKI